METVRLADDARRVLISVNPHAGSQNRQEIVGALSQELTRQRCDVTVFHDIEALVGEAEHALGPGLGLHLVSHAEVFSRKGTEARRGRDANFRLLTSESAARRYRLRLAVSEWKQGGENVE